MSGYVFEDGIVNYNVDIKKTALVDEVHLSLGNEFVLNTLLKYNDIEHNLEISGKIYPLFGSIHEENLVIGELLTDNKLFTVENFKVFGDTSKKYLSYDNKYLENQPTITLVLKNTVSGEVIFLQSAIEKDIFNNIMLIAEKNIRELDLEENDILDKMLRLYLNSSSYKADENTSEVQVSKEVSSDMKNDHLEPTGAPSISRNTLKRFIDDLNRYGTVKLSEYSIPSSFFTSTGWHHYAQSSGSSKYCYSNYSREVDTGEYVSQFAMLDVLAQYISYDDNLEEYTMQLEMYDGMIVEYSSYTGDVYVMYYQVPLKIDNIEFAISNLRGNYNNIFVTRDIYGSVGSNKNYVEAFIGLVPYGEYMEAIWKLTGAHEYKSNAIGSNYTFPNTVQQQMEKYDNEEVIRGIFAKSGRASFDASGHYMELRGKFLYQNTWQLNWEYIYSTSTRL
jgi:hypothetical protein